MPGDCIPNLTRFVMYVQCTRLDCRYYRCWAPACSSGPAATAEPNHGDVHSRPGASNMLNSICNASATNQQAGKASCHSNVSYASRPPEGSVSLTPPRSIRKVGNRHTSSLGVVCVHREVGMAVPAGSMEICQCLEQCSIRGRRLAATRWVGHRLETVPLTFPHRVPQLNLNYARNTVAATVYCLVLPIPEAVHCWLTVPNKFFNIAGHTGAGTLRLRTTAGRNAKPLT
jgi:hypothetical protein